MLRVISIPGSGFWACRVRGFELASEPTVRPRSTCYGSCVPIAIVVAVALAVGWRAIASPPLPVLVTTALFVALLVPHAISAVRWTGSPLGILLESRGVPQAAYTGEVRTSA